MNTDEVFRENPCHSELPDSIYGTFYIYNFRMTSPAPALDRGIAVMQALQKKAPLSLDELAQYVACPKSSLLRILDSLQQNGWVKRNARKHYVPMLRLAPLEQSRDWDSFLVERLADLGRMLQLTIEWYQVKEGQAVITWRFEPESTPIHIRAQVGFPRGPGGEVDAVARILFACTSIQPGKTTWVYRKGDSHPVSAAQIRKEIKAMKRPLFGDQEYNTNGVRRLASGVRNSDGTLKGIIAIAEGFTPKADDLRTQRLAALQSAADDLETFLHKEPL